MRTKGLQTLPRLWIAVLSAIAMVFAVPAFGHLSSGSYLRLEITDRDITGQWDISLRDLDVAIGLDEAGSGNLTWGEVRTRRRDIEAYALSRLTIEAGNSACRMQPTELLIDQHADGGYAVLRFNVVCPVLAHVLTLHYRLLFDIDPTHRGLLTVTDHGVVNSTVLASGRAAYTIVLGAPATSGFFSFVRLGMQHIVGGRDHLLFLVMLLAPAIVTVRRRGMASCLMEAMTLLSLFTAAHAVTVSLAALSIIDVPARVSEAAIAFSIAVTAADNIWPILGPRRGMIAFGFGVIHGLGFATALGPLALGGWSLVAALAGFNLGIEIILVALALAAFSVALAFATYRDVLLTRPVSAKMIMQLCSLSILVLSSYWFADRSFLQGILQ